MSYLAMTAAPVDESNEPRRDTKDIIDNIKKINKQNRTRRRTNSILKNKQDKNISSLHNDDVDDNYDNLESSDKNNLEEFSPLTLPESSGVERRKERDALSDKDRNDIQNHEVTPYTNVENQISEQPSNINDVPMGSDLNIKDYKHNMPSYYNNQIGYDDNNIPNKSELTEKLNYLINLLEEQQDERTQNVTEEVILYSFLGIFIIFVVDSFARVGKYVR